MEVARWVISKNLCSDLNGKNQVDGLTDSRGGAWLKVNNGQGKILITFRHSEMVPFIFFAGLVRALNSQCLPHAELSKKAYMLSASRFALLAAGPTH